MEVRWGRGDFSRSRRGVGRVAVVVGAAERESSVLVLVLVLLRRRRRFWVFCVREEREVEAERGEGAGWGFLGGVVVVVGAEGVCWFWRRWKSGDRERDSRSWTAVRKLEEPDS